MSPVNVILNFQKGAKLFYLTGLINGEYRKNEIHNLARFISVMKFKDLGYRLNHSFIVSDRYRIRFYSQKQLFVQIFNFDL